MASYFPMVKNTAQRIVFPILDADGDPVTGAASDTPDSEYSLNGGSFSDCSNEISELATASGVYYLDLLAGETDGDVVCIQVKTATAGTKTTVLVFYTSAQSLDTTDAAVDAIPTTAMRGTDNVVLSGPTKAEMDTGHGLLATESKQDTIDTVVDGIQTDLSNVTDGLGALKTLIDAVPTASEIQTEMEADGASLLDTLRDELANPTDGLSALKTLIDALNDLSAAQVNAEVDTALSDINLNKIVVASGTVETSGSNSSTQVQTTLTEATNSHYNDMTILFTSGAEAGQARPILDYVGSTGVISWVKAVTATPADSVSFIILANHETPLLAATQTTIDAVPTVAQIQTELEENGASLLDIIRDELANGTDGLSALKALIDAIPTTAMRGTDNVVLLGPTKAQMDTAHGLLATPAQVASELGTYDAPTKAEMDAALLIMKQKVAGTFDRETDSLEAIRDRGDTAWVTGAGGDATEAKQDIIDTVVDAIRVVIDKLADTLELDGAVYRFTLNALEEAPSGTGGDATAANQLLLIKILTNKWEVTGNQFILYDDDGTTPLYTFDLTQDGIPTEFNPDLRTRV